MAYEIPNLDVSITIVDSEGAPQPYLEDLVAQILEALLDIDSRLVAGGL